MKQLPQIPGYTIKRKLGHGGMADVYLGFQERLVREVAIKILDPHLLRDSQFAKRFIKEAQTAAQLIHPNILTIHDVGVAKTGDYDYYYIVMEYLAESLNDRLKRDGPLPPEEALKVVKKVAGALAYAHKQGIIHRDIKADNIMFRFDGSVVLVDFGIARAMDSTTQLTRTGTSIGTPHYMSPEQCRGEKIDGRCDIYSLGVGLYEILIGDVPYKAESTAGIIIKHIQEPVPRLPANLGAYQPLIDKMMAKDRTQRITSGDELVRIIDGLLTPRDSRPAKPMAGPTVVTTVVDTGTGTILEPVRSTVPPVPPVPPLSTATIQEDPRAKNKKKSLLLAGIMAALMLLLAGTLIVVVSRGPSAPPGPATAVEPVSNIETTQSEETTDKKEHTIETDTGTGTDTGSGSGPGDDREKQERKDAGSGTAAAKIADAGDTTGKTGTDAVSKTGDKRADAGNTPPAAEKTKSETTGQKPLITKKPDPRTVTALELSPGTRIDYNLQIKRIQVNLPGRMRPRSLNKLRVYGQITVNLHIDEAGRVTMSLLEDNLAVTPPNARKIVLGLIRREMNGITLEPPRDKQGQPVQFRWRITYKVGKFLNQLILTKQ